MITKWKLALTVAVGAAFTDFGAWKSSAQPAPVPVAKAADAKPVEPKPPEPVATIFGDVPISREAFANHLIRRYGKKELEPFVNKQIIARGFAQEGFTFAPLEIEAALDATCAAAKMTRAQLTEELLKNQSKTLEEWNEDVNIPLQMLTRLTHAKIKAATEAELRRAFDLKYGEKLDCRIILWNSETEARAVYEKVRGSEKEFDAHARRGSQAGQPRSGVAADGRTELIPRARPFEERQAEQAVYAAVAKLQPGEVSPLVPVELEGNKGFIVLKCGKVIPADKNKSFEKEKPALLMDVMSAKISNELPKLRAELMRRAAPKYHLTFPDPVALPNPIPAPKK
ncbi:Foldase protein PrsA [Gemmata sp. SH-PL17]|uniref:peptidylprolyl isomerase n=1 Tax=Gemmata sp. SH-PL17 TaxID=1630693 RepID=UPI00078C92D4|nr:hypothetical protein [Gemmata sp. SH-PL17]AMV29353.1 Foldase protein PrsA [Gemmata sp. SH-PL17]